MHYLPLHSFVAIVVAVVIFRAVCAIGVFLLVLVVGRKYWISFSPIFDQFQYLRLRMKNGEV